MNNKIVLMWSTLLWSLALLAPSPVADAATLYASGQLLVPGNPNLPAGQPGHDDSRENYVFAINSATGAAPPEAWPEDSPENAELLDDIRSQFEGPFGDRRQEIVFIGIDRERLSIETLS